MVGFNDMPFIDRLRPPLTTIRFPHYQVGTEAAQLLLERIAGHTGRSRSSSSPPSWWSAGPPGREQAAAATRHHGPGVATVPAA